MDCPLHSELPSWERSSTLCWPLGEVAGLGFEDNPLETCRNVAGDTMSRADSEGELPFLFQRPLRWSGCSRLHRSVQGSGVTPGNVTRLDSSQSIWRTSYWSSQE